jgi:hypothetical protein
MNRNVPWAAVGLTLAGGFFVFLGGVVMAIIGTVLTLLQIPAHLFFVGILLGILLWVMAGLMVAVPSARIAWGAAAIVLAILSLPFAALGGFVIGFLLSLGGGIAAIVHRGTRRPPPVVIYAAMGPPPPASP